MTLQQEIIRELGVVPTIDAKAEIRNSIEFLKAYLQKNPFLKTLVLGISGGQDSTLAGRLAQLTMEEMRSETNDPNYLMENRLTKKMPKKPSNLSNRTLHYE